MTNKVTMEVVGLKEMEATLKELVTEIQGKKGYPKNPLRNAVRKGAKVIYDEAVRNAQGIDDPDTGTNIAKAMQQVIIPTKERDKFTVRGASIEGYDIYPLARLNKFQRARGSKKWTALHWHFLEFGTVKQRAQPYLRPAAESKRQAAIDTFTTALKDSIKKIKNKLARENKAKVK